MRKILTLAIIQQGNKVLLGMKKRGFGANRWNGFGGKVEPGEEIEMAAKREVFEEVGLKLDDLWEIGNIDFSWQSKPEDILEVHVFKATKYTGVPTESPEMKPQWFAIDKLPFDSMWSDDPVWFPYFLADKKFKASFVFDFQDNVLEHNIVEI